MPAKLVVEGIHFRKGHIWNMTGNGKLTRIVNCSFDAWETPLSLNIGTGSDDQPAEISNCWIPGRVFIYGPAMVRDCLLGAGVYAAPGERRLELNRCVVWNPGLGPTMNGHRGIAFTSGSEPVLNITARGTLLETGHLTYAIGSDQLRWQGSGNVYRTAEAGVVDRLREVWKSPENGSVEAEPLLWDPQHWRLLPESPGYRAGADGKDLGADVERVGRTVAGPDRKATE